MQIIFVVSTLFWSEIIIITELICYCDLAWEILGTTEHTFHFSRPGFPPTWPVKVDEIIVGAMSIMKTSFTWEELIPLFARRGICCKNMKRDSRKRRLREEQFGQLT